MLAPIVDFSQKLQDNNPPKTTSNSAKGSFWVSVSQPSQETTINECFLEKQSFRPSLAFPLFTRIAGLRSTFIQIINKIEQIPKVY